MHLQRKIMGFSRDVGRRLDRALGENLIGLYLHGSATMGAFQYLRSDFDMLAVVEEPLTKDQQRQIAELLMDPEMPCPGSGLELSIVTDASLDVESHSPPFELHLCTVPEARTFVDGHGHPGDPDLLLHYAVAREKGRAIIGPEPEEMFPIIPRSWVLEAMADELGWAVANATPGYAVLNAVRALRYAYTGELVSKQEGAYWFFRQRKNMMPVRLALKQHLGRSATGPSQEHAERFVGWVLDEINRVRMDLDEDE